MTMGSRISGISWMRRFSYFYFYIFRLFCKNPFSQNLYHLPLPISSSMLPITDNHMHIDLNFRGLDAVNDFCRAGGTHIILVSKPSWTLGFNIKTGSDFAQVFDETLHVAELINKKTDATAFVVLGVHPAEITKLSDTTGTAMSLSLDDTVSTMKGGLELAQRYVADGRAVGIKTGRPHYPVADDVWALSNEVMEYGFSLGAEAGCAVQIHTETVGVAELEDIAQRAQRSGIEPNKVVKHFCPPLVAECEKLGLFPGVIAGKGAIETAIAEGSRFMMETDYIDDSERPGAVLGPKTIPKRTKKLVEEYGEEVFYRIHKDNPEKVYGIEIEV